MIGRPTSGPSGYLLVSHIYNFGSEPVSLEIGGRVHVDTPEAGPNWGIRAAATFLFPKK
jgi:hypothetical protein